MSDSRRNRRWRVIWKTWRWPQGFQAENCFHTALFVRFLHMHTSTLKQIKITWTLSSCMRLVHLIGHFTLTNINFALVLCITNPNMWFRMPMINYSGACDNISLYLKGLRSHFSSQVILYSLIDSLTFTGYQSVSPSQVRQDYILQVRVKGYSLLS